MPAWTPGPWFIEPHGDILNVSAAGRVGRVEIAAVEIGFFSDEVNAEQSANAQLIVTAPDLFDALAEMVEAYDSDDGHGPIPVIEKAKAALTKSRATR